MLGVADDCDKIEDYEPKNSLVVTPTKIARFYRSAPYTKEFYPWSGEK